MDAYEAKVSRGAGLAPMWSVVLGPEGRPPDWKRPLASFNRDRLDGYEDAFGQRAAGALWSSGTRPHAWEDPVGTRATRRHG